MFKTCFFHSECGLTSTVATAYQNIITLPCYFNVGVAHKHNPRN